MRFCIPTYKRCRVLTAETLINAGFKPSDISIATQTQEDYEKIKSIYGGIGIEVILDETKHNAAGNRNQLIERYWDDGELSLVMMDDDIYEVSFNEEQLMVLQRYMLDSGIKMLEIDCHGLDEGGETHGNVWLDWAYGGCCFMLSTCGKMYKLDEEFDICEDNELALRLMSSGEKIAYTTACRVKTLETGTMGNSKTSGGCEEVYSSGSMQKCLEMLSKKYPNKVQMDGLIKGKPVFIWGVKDYAQIRF